MVNHLVWRKISIWPCFHCCFLFLLSFFPWTITDTFLISFHSSSHTFRPISLFYYIILQILIKWLVLINFFQFFFFCCCFLGCLSEFVIMEESSEEKMSTNTTLLSHTHETQFIHSNSHSGFLWIFLLFFVFSFVGLINNVFSSMFYLSEIESYLFFIL